MGAENYNLKKEIKQFEQHLETKDQELDVLQKKTQADSVELMTLRRACQIQKDDLYKFELKLESSMEQLEQLQTAVQDAKDEVTKEFQEKITERENEMEKEKQIMKDRLHEVLSNEANLLNRIKSLESDEGYGRAEVDKALAKEREISELNQHLQYNVECLDRELQNALQVIETQKGQVKVVRDENDLAKIVEQEESIDNLQQELGYVKKELIEARANKSASDDKLSHVQDKIETMQNNINSLSDEGTRFKKVITNLEESLEIKTTEAQHLTELVAKMESSSSSDEMNKVQIADLKTELAKAEENLKIRTDELLQSKKDLRVKDEEIQQREIEISCLRGQATNLQDDLDILKQRMSKTQNDLNLSMGENERLSEELTRQQALYTELKKMRGRGEEMDMLQELEQDSREAQKHIVSLEHELGNQSLQIESLTEEKIRLLREVAQLKATGNGNVDVSGSTNNTATTGGYYYTSPAPPVTTSGGNTNSQILSGSQLVPKSRQTEPFQML